MVRRYDFITFIALLLSLIYYIALDFAKYIGLINIFSLKHTWKIDETSVTVQRYKNVYNIVKIIEVTVIHHQKLNAISATDRML